jgi:hypothetical protein
VEYSNDGMPSPNAKVDRIGKMTNPDALDISDLSGSGAAPRMRRSVPRLSLQ